MRVDDMSAIYIKCVCETCESTWELGQFGLLTQYEYLEQLYTLCALPDDVLGC